MQPHRILLSMAAQVITPILSGAVMDVNPAMLFAYITGMGVLMGLSVAGALAAGGRGSGQRT